MSVHLTKLTDPSQVIHEVAWRLRREIPRTAYLRDLVYADDLGLPVYVWTGKDREGKRMAVTWVTTGAGGALLSAYEIAGR